MKRQEKLVSEGEEAVCRTICDDPFGTVKLLDSAFEAGDVGDLRMLRNSWPRSDRQSHELCHSRDSIILQNR